MAKLNPKQERFAHEYITDLNGKQAAIRSGYSQKTAEVHASRLLSNAKVQELIQSLMNERAKETKIDTSRVLTEIARLAYSDARRLFNDLGQLKNLKDMDDETAAAVASVEVVTKRVPGGEPTDVEYVTKIKMWDKPKSLDMLSKHLKLYKDSLEINHSFGPNPDDLAKLTPKELEDYIALTKKMTGGE